MEDHFDKELENLSMGEPNIILSGKGETDEALENEEIDSEITKDDLKNRCMKIFINFSQFSKKDKDYFLSQQALIKILKGVNLIDERTLKITDIDILFKKVTSYGTRLNINQFLDFIVLVAEKLDPNHYKEDPKEAVAQIIKTFFEPFAKYLEKKSGEENQKNINMSTNNVLVQNSIEQIIERFCCDHKTYDMMNSIYYALKEIYLSYFSVELKPLEVEKILPISFQGLLDFCKDFEITNYLCSINQLVIYWNVMLKTPIEEITRNNEIPLLVEEKKDMGAVFTFSKFVALLIYFAIMTFNKYKLGYNSITNSEKVLFFLEKLENSVGFQNLERRTNKPHSSKLTLIPQKDLVKALNSTINKTFKLAEENKRSEITEKLKEYNEKSKNPGEIVNLKQLLNIIPEAYARVEGKFEILKEIFLNYSRKANKLNNGKISYSSYLKFLKDAKLIFDPVMEAKKKDLKLKLKNKKKQSSNENSLILDPKSYARSPLRTFNSSILTKSDSAKRITKSSLPPNQRKNDAFKLPKGKLLETDVELIFLKLTGFKNFDNSEKIKAQFVHNKGITLDFDKSQKGMVIDKSNRVKSSTSNVPHKMDFCLFIKSFELLGKKLHPDRNLDQAFVIFIEKDLKRLLTENDSIFNEKRKLQDLLHNLKKGDTVEAMRDVSPLIQPHYENYSNPSGMMNFDQFFNFYKEYSIFPEMVNLIQVKNIYFTLSDIYSRQLNFPPGQVQQINVSKSIDSQNKNVATGSVQDPNYVNRRAINKNDYITYDLFLESLALAANIMKNNVDYKNADKVLYLLEKISHSEAAKKCLMKSGKTFYTSKEYIDQAYFLRQKYPGFYGKKETTKEESKQPRKFEDIFD